MVTAQQRRSAVAYVQETAAVSQRCACRWLGVARTPIRYQWYQGDITWARHAATWDDAETAFDRLGNRLARGQLYAAR